MLIISLDVPRIVNPEFNLQGQAVNYIAMQMFCNVHWKTCGENDVRGGALDMGFLRTTMFLLTLLCRGDCGQ
jgi:hypothetical protein